MKWIFFLTLLLAGCGTENSNTSSYGDSFNEQGSTGLRVRYFDNSTPRIELIQQIYIDTMACVGINMPGPLVVFVEEITNNPDGRSAEVVFESHTIAVQNSATRDTYFLTELLKHEFIHLLLNWNEKLTIEQNQKHNSPLFAICSTIQI